jgi:hypothetical protein
VDIRLQRRSVRGVKPLASAGVMLAATLLLSAWLGSSRAEAARFGSSPDLASHASWLEPKASSATTTLRSSRLVFGGQLRCTATVSSPVRAGQPMQVRFVLRNVSKHRVRGIYFGGWGEGLGDPSLVLNAPDGTTYNTNAVFEVSIPSSLPHSLRRGAKQTSVASVAVRWGGPLQVIPTCEKKTLPTLSVPVVAAGPPADDNAAIAEVVAAAGHLLDQCRPQMPGVPVNGEINPPSGSVPPMSAQCSVSVGSEGSFWVAQVLVVSPPDLSGISIGSPYETLPFLPMSDSPYEAIAWEFVVTRGNAIPVVAGDELGMTSSDQIADWLWTPTGWQGGGAPECPGVTSLGYSANLTPGPQIWFISACPAPAP